MFPIVSPIFLRPVAHVEYLSPCSLPFVHHPTLKIMYSIPFHYASERCPSTNHTESSVDMRDVLNMEENKETLNKQNTVSY